MPLFESADLRTFARDVFIACKVPVDIAEEVAMALSLADLSGHPSHGAIRVPSYVEMIDDGRVIPANRPFDISRSANTVLIDANWGFGHPAAAYSTRAVASMALESGIALAGCVHLNHIGRLGQWAELAAELGIVLIMVTGGEYTIMSGTPFGGRGKVLSTNPMAAAVPSATSGSMILDFATTASAEGKLKVARAKGMQVPPNTIIDKHGNPTTDPEDFYDGGMLLPFGGHKGYALSLLVDALGSCLTGSWQTEDGVFTATIGDGEATIEIEADGDIVLRQDTGLPDGDFGLPFTTEEIGEGVEQMVGALESGLRHLGEEVSGSLRIEEDIRDLRGRIRERVQRDVDRFMKRQGRRVKRAARKSTQTETRRAAKAGRTATASATDGKTGESDDDTRMILRMVADGKISPEEADRLLQALR